jgi:hypothetical protein
MQTRSGTLIGCGDFFLSFFVIFFGYKTFMLTDVRLLLLLVLGFYLSLV